MAWFALARVLFVAAVAYAAALLQPLPFGIAVNVAFALALAALVVVFESRLRETSVTHMLGALIGGIRRRAECRFWANPSLRLGHYQSELRATSSGGRKKPCVARWIKRGRVKDLRNACSVAFEP